MNLMYINVGAERSYLSTAVVNYNKTHYNYVTCTCELVTKKVYTNNEISN